MSYLFAPKWAIFCFIHWQRCSLKSSKIWIESWQNYWSITGQSPCFIKQRCAGILEDLLKYLSGHFNVELAKHFLSELGCHVVSECWFEGFRKSEFPGLRVPICLASQDRTIFEYSMECWITIRNHGVDHPPTLADCWITIRSHDVDHPSTLAALPSLRKWVAISSLNKYQSLYCIVAYKLPLYGYQSPALEGTAHTHSKQDYSPARYSSHSTVVIYTVRYMRAWTKK